MDGEQTLLSYAATYHQFFFLSERLASLKAATPRQLGNDEIVLRFMYNLN